MHRFLWLSFAALLLAGIAVAPSGGATQSESRWVITDLGVPAGEETEALAINEEGQIIARGANAEGSVNRAFLWQAGTLTDLGTLGGRRSDPTALNDRGQVIGNSETKGGYTRAFLWRDGRMKDLGTLGGRQSVANAINNRGQVVGRAQTKRKDANGSVTFRGFLWDRDRMRDLGTLGGENSEALAINERGQIVGWSETASGEGHAFLWEKGKMRDLGVQSGFATSSAPTLNERGQVLVVSETESGMESSVFLWQGGHRSRLSDALRAASINDRGWTVGLGDHGPALWKAGRSAWLQPIYLTIAGLEGSAVAINERGQIVGEAWTRNGDESHATLWQNGKRTDLGTLPRSEFSQASAINERGEIVGSSEKKYGDANHAVLWTLKR